MVAEPDGRLQDALAFEIGAALRVAQLKRPREHQHPIRWDDELCRGGQTVHGRSCRDHARTVAGDDGIDPVVVDVAVEHLTPAAGDRESEAIAVVGRLIEAGDHDGILTSPLDPAVKRDDAGGIVAVKDVDLALSLIHI